MTDNQLAPVSGEREQIVAWLKAQAGRCLENKRQLREMLSPEDWKGLTSSEMAYRFAAKAIKRGDHLPPVCHGGVE